VMLLPYYIASMNIEHEYYELTGEYAPFDGICLVDTFELAEIDQIAMFTAENTERVQRQKEIPIFVIIGNPPYNAGQVNENDNNKNRIYPVLDKKIFNTYAKDSKAKLVRKLNDPYVKAIKWATDRINNEGIITYVTNNSFLDGRGFDGMRYHLTKNFSEIYHINLKGNARTSGEARKREAGNIFDDKIRVSIGISFFIKKKNKKVCNINIYSVDDFLKSHQKKEFLEIKNSYEKIQFQKIKPDTNNNWLNDNIDFNFNTYIALGDKNTNKSIFYMYSLGICSNNDSFMYNSNKSTLIKVVNQMVTEYKNSYLLWLAKNQLDELDKFLKIDETKLKWIRRTKRSLLRGIKIDYNFNKIRFSLYRPYFKQFYYFERYFCEEIYQQKKILPIEKKELENKIICLMAPGCNKKFYTIITNIIPDLHLTGDTQCFPFYIYDEDGSNRRDNITDWSLREYRKHYKDESISKRDIFYYVYGLLHHHGYRKKYAANLRRELPHLPFAPDFWTFSGAGKQLGDLHINYEQQVEYPLDMLENEDKPLNWRVEKMRLSKDKTYIIYNDFLTLGGIPEETFKYRLGNRSALEWIIEQYRIKTDPRSGITNDPNREDDPEYIVRLVKQIVTVSLETVKIVTSLPVFE